MIKFSKLKTTSVLLCVLFGINLSLAAQAVNFSVSPQDLTVGKEMAIVLSIDTENQEINAVEMRLKFSPDEFLIKDINDGNSIINLWIEKPSFFNPPVGGQSKGEISFSGIIPGGFYGASGQLLKIILFPQKFGEASFEIAEAKVLLNDGKGMEAKTKIFNFQFSISKETPGFEFQVPSFKDTDPPEDFALKIASDPNIFGGKYFLVFATQDKGSGVDYYAIHETKRKINIQRETNAKWIVAESPYLLKDQKLRSYIYVKAVDKAGNERVAVVPAQNPLAWYEIWWIWGIIIIGIVIGYTLWRIKRKKSFFV